MDLMSVGGRLWDFAAFTVVPFVVVLGVMITVHELGHFLAARLIGVRVLVFKIGFGKPLWSRTKGHTEYALGWIPIGGYVKLFGDPTEVEDQEADTPLEEIPEEDKKEALFYRPWHHKTLVFVAGSAMNILLAFALSPLPFMLGVAEVPAVVGEVEPGSPAEVAGIKANDRVVSVDGKEVASFMKLKLLEALNPEKTVVYVVDRKGERLTFEVKLRPGTDPKIGPIGESGIGEPISAQVGGLVADDPADKAGLLVGDTIIEIAGAPIAGWSDLVDAVTHSEGRELAVVVTRGGGKKEFRITPVEKESEGGKRYMIGISPFQEREIVRYGAGEAAVRGMKKCVEDVALVYVSLWKLLSGQISPKLMSGPLGIGAITSYAAHSGIAALLGFVVMISINLGVLNLLPFPPLDGGHVVFTLAEAITGRELKMEHKEWVFRVGFFLLIGLMVLVTVQDVFRYKGDMWNFLRDIGKGLGLG